MRAIVTFAAAAIVAGIIVPHYAAQMNDTKPAPSAPHGAPEASASSTARSVIVPRDERGHFEVEGRIDGMRLDFMVDTGASAIALTADTAAMLGIHPTRNEFTTLVRTANGTVHAAPVRLSTVEIDDIMVRDVAALVMPEQALSDNLLGLSFLSRLRHFEYSDGKLTLEQ